MFTMKWFVTIDTGITCCIVGTVYPDLKLRNKNYIADTVRPVTVWVHITTSYTYKGLKFVFSLFRLFLYVSLQLFLSISFFNFFSLHKEMSKMNPLRTRLCIRNRQVLRFIHVNSTEIFYIWIIFKVWFSQDLV